MEMKIPTTKNHAMAGGAVLAMLFLALAAAPNAAYSQDEDESITASCLKGNTDEGNYVGDISVNDPRNAGSDCNGEYIDCEGECVGCVVDTEGNRVCYDNDRIRVPATH